MENDIAFEVAIDGNLVRIENIQAPAKNSLSDWDKNWLRTNVVIKTGAFEGQFSADFMTTDFERFKQEIKKLDGDFNGVAIFSGYEDYLELNIKGDGIGHFKIKGIANDGSSNRLSFEMDFDQTLLNNLYDQLEAITKQFPIIGDLKIKNE